MKFLQFIAIILLFCAFFGCKSSECVEKQKEDCLCTFEYNPVCGCNDKTYGNACEAECAGITAYVKGACK